MELEGPKPALIVVLAGLVTLIAPSILSGSTNYMISSAISGIIITALAAFRAVKPDEEVPLPALPLAVGLFGLWSITSPFVIGEGLNTTGILLVVSGVIATVIPAKMVLDKLR